MIKVKNGVATREQIPTFLLGLSQESLLDLSWTDESLGVKDCAWYPEENNYQQLNHGEKYGDEILIVDSKNFLVKVSNKILKMTDEEILLVNEAKANEIRQQRNQLLKESDWTQLSDSPVDKAAWAVYRQALRDITKNADFPYCSLPIAP